MKVLVKVFCILVILAAANARAETEDRDLAGFNRVAFALPGSLTLERGDDFAVRIDATADVLERIDTEVSDNELSIRWKQGMFGLAGHPSGRIVVHVTLPALEALEVAGSGDVEGGTWLSDAFSVEVSGSGDVEFTELTTEELRVELSGSGDLAVPKVDAARVRIEINGSGGVELTGAADRQKIEITGSGDVNVGNLEGSRVDVEIMGSGNAKVWANDTLSAQIMGSGDVRYRGSPRVQTEHHGSGSVRAL